MSLAVFWVALFFLGVLLNALFAGYETGFVASNPIRVRHMAEKEGNVRARQLMAYLERPDRMITVVLLGTNLALIMGTIAITKYMAGHSETDQAGEMWATIIATPMFLVFGEVFPKSMFRIHPTRLALALLPVMRLADWIFAPIAIPVTALSRQLVRASDGERQGIRTFMRTPEDVRVLVDESADQGTIDAEEREMIHSVMDLQKSNAKEVMVPRIDIKALPETASRRSFIGMFRESGHTRLPVYRENIDEIVGTVNAFDVLTAEKWDEGSAVRLMEEAVHVPDTMKLDDVLETLRNARQHIAIVTDEYGGTDGLITIEDILEEIFGEIHDEFDKDETTIRRVGINAFVVDARMPLEDAAEAMGVTLTDDEVETVGGWVMHATGRIPEQGEEIVHNEFRITVLAGGPNFISSLRVELIPEAKKEHDEQ
jgi:putative hemolysin